MKNAIVRTQDNIFFKFNPSNAQAMRIQYLENDLEVTQVKYFVYLQDDTEEFKSGKATFFDSINECSYFYMKKIRENKYTYIDYGIEFNCGSYIVEKRYIER